MRIFKKKSLLKIWCMIVLIIVFFLFGAQSFALLNDKYLNGVFLYSYSDKLGALQKEKHCKTVFLGGSSVLFGVNAEHYGKISGKSAINMGLNAGAGVYDLYLATANPYLKAGDTVVLAFEYDAYTKNWIEFNNITLDLAHTAPNYAKTLSFYDKMDYCFQQHVRYYKKTFDNICDLLSTKSIYARKNINSFGDFDLNYTKNSAVRAPMQKPNDFVINPESIVAIQRYIRDFEDRGIRVFIAYPPAYLDAREEDILEFDKKLREQLGEWIIGKITDWTFDTGEKFFDTAYHLNASATIEHTVYYYDLINKIESEL